MHWAVAIGWPTSWDLPTEKYSPKLTALFGMLPHCDVPDDQLPLVRTDETGWTCHAKVQSGSISLDDSTTP